MKKPLFIGMMMFLIAFSLSHYTSADIQIETVQKPLTVQELVSKYSKEYKVSSKVMMGVIKCENKGLNPTSQSQLKYKKGNRWKKPAGSYEQSYGLVQIHLPDHPDITLAQATDPDFSVEFLASNLAKGRGSMWTCYRNLYA